METNDNPSMPTIITSVAGKWVGIIMAWHQAEELVDALGDALEEIEWAKMNQPGGLADVSKTEDALEDLRRRLTADLHRPS